MKSVIAVLCLVAAANAGVLTSVVAPTVIQRAPALDSAVIKSDRIGGNFAYSVAEAHAHIASTPIVQHVATPVAVSYSAPVVQHVVQQQIVAAPIARAVSVIGAPSVIAAPALTRTVIAGPQIVTSLGAPAATVRIA